MIYKLISPALKLELLHPLSNPFSPAIAENELICKIYLKEPKYQIMQAQTHTSVIAVLTSLHISFFKQYL